MSFDNEITRLFNIEFPIIGAPMFLVSYVDLVVAVSEAGGLGSFPAQNYRDLSELKDAIQEIRQKTNKPFAINIVMNRKYNPGWKEQLDTILNEKTPIIIASLGVPRTTIKEVKSMGAKIICDVVDSRHAVLLESLGADALVAVSAGAGGHAGIITPFSLIPMLAGKTNLPIIAAGSISGGKQMAASFCLGAQAVYVGTRLLASSESMASDKYKSMVVNSSAEHIVYSDQVSGIGANWIKESLESAGFHDNSNVTLNTPTHHNLDGQETMNNFKRWRDIWSAGHGVSQIDKVLPADKIMSQMVKEYLEVINKF